MEIHNEQKSRIITIDCVESEKHYYPSYRLIVKIEVDEVFARFSKSIWVSEVDINLFINSLKILEVSRNGEAHLKSMSPDEFHLILKNKDKLGHILACLQMKQTNYNDYTINLNIEFEIDPTQILKLVGELKNWLK